MLYRHGWNYLPVAVSAFALPVPGLVAQEAEVESAVEATLDALSDGRYEEFLSHFAPTARGFFLDGGALLATGFSAYQLNLAAEAGAGIDIELDDLDSKVHGDAAVSVAYLEGSVTLPGGVVIDGTWRYSETRVLSDGAWKVVQFHMSPMSAPAGGQPSSSSRSP